MKLQVTIDSGTLAGRSFDLESGFLSIGRSDNCSIRFDPLTERIASKQHAFIEAKADGYYLTDNNSTNGTFLNGAPVTAANLSSGDTIQLASASTSNKRSARRHNNKITPIKIPNGLRNFVIVFHSEPQNPGPESSESFN